MHFGIREFGMATSLTGMALHGGIVPIGATFFVFSDYMRGALRVAAISKAPVRYFFSHDSIGVGQDGPTHQPVDQLASLRAIPGLDVIRPADANECAAVFDAFLAVDGPAALILSRQELPVLDETLAPAFGTALDGAYVLADPDGAAATLLGTGSEVHLCLDAAKLLAAEGTPVRVVSMPSWEWFDRSPFEYQATVLGEDAPVISVEAGVTLGWERYADESIGIDTFGTSAPGDVALEFFGFTAAAVATTVRRRCSARVTSLRALYEVGGQSPWLDNIRRDWLEDGTMAALVEDGIRGVTSNPTIFSKALVATDLYDAELRALPASVSDEEAFVELAGKDVTTTSALLAATFEASEGADGFVSFEVAPTLAQRHRPRRSRLAAPYRSAFALANLLVKVPATEAGLPAITALLADGISVNVTLIFGLEPLRPGHRRVPRGPRAAQPQRSRPLRRSPRWRRSSSRGSTPRWTGGSTPQVPTPHCTGVPPSPRPCSPTSCSSSASQDGGSRRLAPRARASSDRCGPRRRRRTRPTPTCSTSTR